jgi:hypothetical protein
MRRSSLILSSIAALLMPAALAAQSQSLADAARQYRMTKPATPASRVYTNDNLPTSGGLSVTGPAPAAAPSSAAPDKPAAPAKDPKAEAQAKAERDRLEADWRGRFRKQREAITLLEREAAALDREIKLRPQGVACATSNVCNDKAAKDQQIQQEKQKLEDMKDELRKSELPAAWAE